MSELTEHFLTLDLCKAPFRGFLFRKNGQESLVIAQSEITRSADETLQSALHRLVSPLPPTWENAIVLSLTPTYHSFHLSLPFRDKKQINKVLASEVQDFSPFELEDFITVPTISANGTTSSSHVHVALSDKTSLRELLQSCQEADIDPVAIVPPSVAISYFRDTTTEGYQLVILTDLDNTHLALFKGEGLIAERSFLKRESDETLLHSIISLTEQAGTSLNKIQWTGTAPSPTLRRALPVAPIEIHPLPPGAHDVPAALALALSHLHDMASIPGNFRIGEFRLRPRLGVLWEGSSIIRRSFLGLVIVVALALGGYASFLSFSAAALQQAIRDQVTRVLPQADQTESPLDQLRAEAGNLDRQLVGLGNLQKRSPVEVLSVISKDIPSTIGVQINSLEIKDGITTLEGLVPEYTSIEKMKREFDKKRLSYCSVKLSNVSDSGARKQFRVELALCDQG